MNFLSLAMYARTHGLLYSRQHCAQMRNLGRITVPSDTVHEIRGGISFVAPVSSLCGRYTWPCFPPLPRFTSIPTARAPWLVSARTSESTTPGSACAWLRGPYCNSSISCYKCTCQQCSSVHLLHVKAHTAGTDIHSVGNRLTDYQANLSRNKPAKPSPPGLDDAQNRHPPPM